VPPLHKHLGYVRLWEELWRVKDLRNKVIFEVFGLKENK
jgi:hypothetical protein